MTFAFGDKNYITPQGLEALRKELEKLKYQERPEVTKVVAWAASNGDRSENGDYIYGKKRLREIDKRIHFLSKRIDSAEVIDPDSLRLEYVSFGATVRLRDEEDRELTYTIVGVDEVDVSQRKISWRSPLGAALLKARAKAGDYVTYEAPRGEQEIVVLSVEYKPIE